MSILSQPMNENAVSGVPNLSGVRVINLNKFGSPNPIFPG